MARRGVARASGLVPPVDRRDGFDPEPPIRHRAQCPLPRGGYPEASTRRRVLEGVTGTSFSETSRASMLKCHQAPQALLLLSTQARYLNVVNRGKYSEIVLKAFECTRCNMPSCGNHPALVQKK